LENYIALHYSYLEWLKYKTAKPLLYTVYRTKPKQLGRKWSGKGGSEKNSQRWSWGDVWRETVLEAAYSNRKRTIVNSGQPCTYVGSLVVRTTTTGDGGSWNQRRDGCRLP